MRLESALYSSMSGLNVHGQAISVIGDNVSNANTTAYKTQRPEFADLVSQAGDPASPNVEGGGGGVGMRRVRSTSEQGVVETTGRPLDIAIAGDGYLQTGSVTDKSFTRNGVLSVSATGVLVDSSGQPVLGYQGTGTTLGQIDMTAVNLAGAATSAATVIGNLNSASGVTTPPTGPQTFSAINKVASSISTLEVFDSLGVRHALTLGYFKTAANTWTVQAYADGGDTGATAGVPQLVGSTTLNFGTDGIIPEASKAGAVLTANAAWAGGAAAGSFTVDLGNFTQYGGTNDIKSVSQNGTGAGKIKDYQIDKDGKVYATLDSGLPSLIGSIVLANFVNKDGLIRTGNSTYIAGPEVGTESQALPGASGVGQLAGASLERSTVDIAEQFVNLVIYQRGYQANSQALNVANDTLKQTIQLMR